MRPSALLVILLAPLQKLELVGDGPTLERCDAMLAWFAEHGVAQ